MILLGMQRECQRLSVQPQFRDSRDKKDMVDDFEKSIRVQVSVPHSSRLENIKIYANPKRDGAYRGPKNLGGLLELKNIVGCDPSKQGQNGYYYYCIAPCARNTLNALILFLGS